MLTTWKPASPLVAPPARVCAAALRLIATPWYGVVPIDDVAVDVALLSVAVNVTVPEVPIRLTGNGIDTLVFPPPLASDTEPSTGSHAATPEHVARYDTLLTPVFTLLFVMENVSASDVVWAGSVLDGVIAPAVT
ncbi:MAG TPA: hypothetical protein VKH19_15860 [Gemmatimonadaceae bacterium]|nr:hypothetical protein [Gemmatimonadaceae bacterium]